MHLEEDCPFSEFDCSRCDEKIQRQELEEHDCQPEDQTNNEELIESLIKDA